MCMCIHIYMFVIILSGKAPVTNGMATVTVDELECNATYTIQAGGKFNGSSLGPRSSHGSITTDICDEEEDDDDEEEEVAKKTADGGTK